MMKAYPLFIVMCIAGCMTSTSHRSPWVYPEAEVIEQGPDKLSQRLHRFLAEDDLRPFIRSNDLTRVQEDPFHTQDAIAVSFSTPSLGMEVDMYYDHVFFAHGWRKYRGMFPHEITGNGPDYVNVYFKGDRFVKIHMFGPWDHALVSDNFVWSNAWFTMSFVGLHPSELLGEKYRTSEPKHGVY
jgi:hypothetical protein